MPRGRVLVVGQGFVGRLFAEVLRARGDDVYAIDARAERAGRAPDGPVDAAVLCAPAAPLDAVAPGGTVLVFSPAAPVDLDLVYRSELTLTGSRSATPRHMRAALELLPELDLPEPTVLPLDRFEDGLDALPLRRCAQGRLHAVRALRFHGPGDLRLEDVPNPEAGTGRRARPGRGRAHRRHRPEDLPARPPGPPPRAAEPVRARVLRHRRRHRQARRRRQLGRGQTTAAAPIELLNGAYAELIVVPAAIAAVNLLPVPAGLAPEVAAMVEPLACCLRGVERAEVQAGDRVAILGAGPIGLMLCACVADAGGRPEVVGGRAERRALVPEFGGRTGDGDGADVVIEAAGTDEAWQRALELVRPGGTVVYFGGREAGAELRVDTYRLHYEELTLRGAFHHAPRHVRAALAFLASGAYPWERLSRTRSGSRTLPALLRRPARATT